jgi:hypothetical protein
MTACPVAGHARPRTGGDVPDRTLPGKWASSELRPPLRPSGEQPAAKTSPTPRSVSVRPVSDVRLRGGWRHPWCRLQDSYPLPTLELQRVGVAGASLRP